MAIQQNQDTIFLLLLFLFFSQKYVFSWLHICTLNPTALPLRWCVSYPWAPVCWIFLHLFSLPTIPPPLPPPPYNKPALSPME